MGALQPDDLPDVIIRKAIDLGASIAGIADIAELRSAPSYKAIKRDQWPVDAKSVLAFALEHKKTEAELDWWDNKKGGTPGNRRLIQTAESLKEYLLKELNIPSQPLPYDPEKGGIFLKDAAVLAGLGIIGKNNILITPQFGPRVRLRAMFLDRELRPTGPVDYSPCEGCDMPCRRVCPRKAFDQEGAYTREMCMKQMDADIQNAAESGKTDPDKTAVKYCRACELACSATLLK